jgi:predicted ATPase/class 3 adenylate cyclase
MEADGGAATCSTCGASMPLGCSWCGAVNPRGVAYCGGCGGELSGAAPPKSRRDGRPSSVPVPPIGAGRVASVGERKQVTVLFADLGGSFNAIQGADPEEAEALLDGVVSLMTEAVHRFDGTVNQVLGDGIMAVFGAPVSHEDHAVRGACAALAMQVAVRRLTNPSWAARGIAPEIRVGINSGEVVVRSVRNELTLEYRAVGSTTHLAARMEQMASRGSILLTENVMRLGRGMLRARPLGPLSVRGVIEPVHAFELTGVATRTRFQATLARGLSPFIGRDAALSVLVEALRGAVSGRSAAVLVTGDPGIGKSRLCHELVRSADARACRVLEASAPSYARTTPHALLAGLVKSLLEIDDDDSPESVERKAGAHLAAIGLADKKVLSVVLELVGIIRGDDPWQELDPVQRMRAIEQAVRELLTRWCNEGPAIVLLEDLHWADTESMAFVYGLFRSLPGDRTLLLGTSRLEPRPLWPEGADVPACALEPLPPADSGALLTALVGRDQSLAALRTRLADRTEGNPFFLEESVRAYVDMGTLQGTPGGYVVRKGAPDILVPATIESLVATRLDQIDLEALEVLQAAAVLGDESPVDVLRTVTELEPADFDPRFAKLTGADLFYQTGPFRAPVFRFRHALIRDVAYGQMLRARRRELHGRALQTLESLHETRLAENVERLADHAYQAEIWIKSAHYHKLACVRAASRGANAQAVSHLDRGLAVLSRAEPGEARDLLAIDLRLVALAPLWPFGDHERIISLLHEAQTCAQALGDKKCLAKIYSQLGTTLWLRGCHAEAMEVAERAHALARELEHFPLATAARFSLALLHHARGQLTDGLSMFRQLISEIRGPIASRRLGWAGYPSVLARAFVISCNGLRGDFAEADRMFAEGRSMADELDHPYSRTMILEEYGFCQLVRGDVRSARELLELAMRICIENEVTVMHAPIAARLGSALIESGNLAEGRALIEDALARETHRTAGHYAQTYLLLALSDAHVRGEEPALALASARRAEEITRLAGEGAYHVCALTQLAAALACARDRVGALDAHASALRQARELEMAPFEALVLEGRAGVLADQGDRAQGLRELDSAADIWARLGAPARLEKVAAKKEALTAVTRSGTRAPRVRAERSTRRRER